MSNDLIKQKLRESLLEAEEQQKERDSYESDYKEIQSKLLGGVLKASQIMQKSGLGDHLDANKRSLFMKKLKKEKNDENSEYKFSPDELKAIKQVISNPNATTSK